MGSDSECDYQIGDPIDDITLTKRQTDSVFGVRNRGENFLTKDFDLPASIFLNITSLLEQPCLHFTYLMVFQIIKIFARQWLVLSGHS